MIIALCLLGLVQIVWLLVGMIICGDFNERLANHNLRLTRCEERLVMIAQTFEELKTTDLHLAGMISELQTKVS